jgi:hypothetical protein
MSVHQSIAIQLPTLADPLHAAQARFLYSQAGVTYFFPLAAALALCILLWEDAPLTRLGPWMLAVALHTGARYAFLWHLRRQPAREQPPGVGAYAAGAFISGCLWGMAPLLLIPYSPTRLVEFTLFNGLALIIVCGLVAGAAVSYCISMRVLFAFAAPALLPPALYLISLGDRFNSALGGFVLLYFLFIAMASLRMHQQLRVFVEAWDERDRLAGEVHRLKARVAMAERALSRSG